jgi:hypothetical protein
MKKVFAKRIVLPAGLLLAGGIAVVLLLSAAAGPVSEAVGEDPTGPSWEMYLFGGPGDQYGHAIVVQGDQVIVGGYNALLRSYSIPISSTPQWHLAEPVLTYKDPYCLVTTSSDIYSVGLAFPPTCGASDGAGGTEFKSMFGKYLLDGFPIFCSSYNFFPYRGYELYYAAAASNEGGIDYIYAGGTAQQDGSCNGPFILAKYDANGSMVSKVTEPGIGWGWPTFCLGVSTAWGLSVSNSYLYVAGQSLLVYNSEDWDRTWDYWGQRPVLMKYDFDLNRIWKYRANIASGYPGYSGQFYAVTALDNYLYAAGRGYPTGGSQGFDFLVEKFDEAGNRIWSASWGGPYEDALRGIVAVGNRLYAVGYTYKTAHSSDRDGDADVAIYEILPDGSYQLVETIGGSGVDFPYGAATDGQDLYIVGQTASFASDEGNVPPDFEIMLIHYQLNGAPVADDQTVSAEWGVAEDITLSASDEDGDDLTYSIVDPPLHGTLTGEAPNVTYTSECTYFGPDSFTFKANDGTVDSNIATVSITVDKAFAFVGFDPPIDNIPVVNSAKAGSTVPVKWRITNRCGTPISDPGSFNSLTSYTVNCASLSGDPIDSVETYAGASGLQYLGDGYWQYNWKTPKSYAGQCRIMVLTLEEGSTHSAYFSFK